MNLKIGVGNLAATKPDSIPLDPCDVAEIQQLFAPWLAQFVAPTSIWPTRLGLGRDARPCRPHLQPSAG